MKQIIKFEKENCNPCIMVSEYLQTKNIPFETINPFDDPESALKYKIRSVPTTILLNDTNELIRIVGYQPDLLNSMIELL